MKEMILFFFSFSNVNYRSTIVCSNESIFHIRYSRFYPSNSFAFALKNTGVLLICITTAYYVGYVCRIAIRKLV